MNAYKGKVVFVDGVHYPATEAEKVEGEDDRLHADLARPLRWDDGGYRDAEPDEPLHNDTHHASDLELPVGGEG
jgi:hypothetical protein